MTPSVVVATAASNSAGSVVVADNVAMVAGDLRLTWVSVSNTTCATPAGWDLLLTYTLAGTRNGYIFRRPHDGPAEPATTTFTFGATNNYSMASVGVRGAGLGALDFVPTAGTAGSGTSLTTVTETLLRPDSLLLAGFHLLTNGSAATLSTPSGMTLVVQQAGTGTVGHLVGVFSEVAAAPGSVGTRASTGSVSAPWGATMLAVPPRVVLPPGQPDTARRRAANL